MAAEKLTKGRFIQICLLFVLLLCAFLWRTAEHSSKTIPTSPEVTDQPVEKGNVETDKKRAEKQEKDGIDLVKGGEQGVYLDEINIEELKIKNIFIE